MNKIFTKEGKLLDFNINMNYKTNFIRKMLDPSNPITKNELKIASLIYKNPHQNLVNVYMISKNPPYIDYQLLDTDYNITKKQKKEYVNHIRKGILHLHKYNIVYIDFKNIYGDNIGYDKNSKTYKIYDFDSSGILKKNRKEWMKLYTPPNYFNYKKFLIICNNNLEFTPIKSKTDNNKIINSVKKNLNKICNKLELTKIDELLFYLDYNEFL
jgi:hypothetical protein